MSAEVYGWSLETITALSGRSVRYGLAEEAVKLELLQAQQAVLARFQAERGGE